MADRKTDPAGGLFLLGLMLGGAIGAAIGLLYAPHPGAESRRDLADWAEGLRSKLDEEGAGAEGLPASGDAPAAAGTP